MSPNTIGAIWMGLSAGLFACADGTAKALSQNSIHVFEIAFMRYVLCLIFLAPYMLLFQRHLLKTQHPYAHLTRALMVSVAQILGYYALSRMFVADVTAINFARPLCITILAVLMLRERVAWRRWVATIIGFGGVIVMVRPGAAGIDPAALAALGTMLLFSGQSVIIARYADTEKPLQYVFFYHVLATFLFAVPAFLTWRDPTIADLALMLQLGFVSLFAEICTIKALSSGEASVVGPVEYVRLIFAALIGYTVFSEVPGPATWIGAAIIVASALYIARTGRFGARRVRQPR
jgi:drug/metabolite transporter (DMT)-like permease